MLFTGDQCKHTSQWKLWDKESGVFTMDSTIIVALVSFAGTVIGTLGGIVAANKLVSYRLEQLEKKVDLHNNAVERLFRVEEKVVSIEDKIEYLHGK